MPEFQYRREQRVTFEAPDEATAWRLVESFGLSSADDESDDGGELEMIDAEGEDQLDVSGRQPVVSGDSGGPLAVEASDLFMAIVDCDTESRRREYTDTGTLWELLRRAEKFARRVAAERGEEGTSDV